MADLTSGIIIAVMFIALALVAILLLKYYAALQALKNDKAKYVVLRDFTGHSVRLGKYSGYDTVGNKFTLQVLASKDGKQVVEDWFVEDVPEFTIPSIDYPNEKMILCDFKKSNMKERIIHPLVDRSILELGLARGLEALMDVTNPLYRQIDHLKKAIKEREELLQQTRIEYDMERLKYFRQLKESEKELIDEVLKELILAPDYVKSKLVKLREQTNTELKTVDQKMRDRGGSEKVPATSKNPSSTSEQE